MLLSSTSSQDWSKLGGFYYNRIYKDQVTARLKVDFLKEAPLDATYVLTAETTKVDGRKAWVTGTIEHIPENATEPAEVVCKAEALFIEPKVIGHHSH